MLKVDPQALPHLLAGKHLAMVSGTNGKTTTTHFLAAAVRAGLDPSGDRVVHNADGANLHGGITAALSDQPKASWAIIETDERVVADMIRLGRPEVLVLLNFSRDQLDRHHEIKALGRSWRNALAAAGDDGPVVVANADEPLVVWAAQSARQVVWVDTATTWTQDASLCPECGALLLRTQPDETGGHGGHWRCSGCDLAQPEATYRVVDGRIIDPAGAVLDPRLQVPGAFNISNAACALAAAAQLGVPGETAISGMRTVTAPAGRFATTQFGDTTARLLLAKNPAGWAEALPLAQTLGGGAGHRLRRRRRPRRVLAVGRRLRAAGRPDGDRHRTAGPGPGRAAGVRGRGAPLRAGPGPSHGRSPRAGGRDRDVHTVPATAQDGWRLMAELIGRAPVEIVLVYQSLLGIYGDRGNATVLAKRLQWRGYDTDADRGRAR